MSIARLEGSIVDKPPRTDDADLKARVTKALDRSPSAGLAAGVVRDGRLEWFWVYGVADVKSKEPVSAETVFRIGSLTKTITAIAVMQLWERGLVDLDVPANDYLRTFRLVPAKAGFQPASVRHLLTHTAGVGFWLHLSDLFQPWVGSGVRAGRSGAPPLTLYYRRGLPVEVEPGTKWLHSNHGFAALGQIVEDVSGKPFHHYLREHIFDPLGMHHTDLVRSERVTPRLATGYVLWSRGLKPVAEREVPTRWRCRLLFCGGRGQLCVRPHSHGVQRPRLGARPWHPGVHVQGPLPAGSPHTRHGPGV